MKHTISKQQLLFFVSDELTASEKEKVDRHLKRCADCRREVKDLRAMHDLLRNNVPAPADRQIIAWRRDVIRAIRAEGPERSPWIFIRDFFGFSEGPFLRPALSMLALGCLAFVIGFSVAGSERVASTLFAPIAYDPYGNPQAETEGLGDAQVVSVDIISKDDVSGDIEFEFEATFRSLVRGNMSDPSIQGILARALISSQNPGVRLRAAHAFSETLPVDRFPGKTRDVIKSSLVSAVKYDENQGVRLEALRALREFMPDSVATSAIVYVMMHDESSAMKIAAISSLDLNKYTEGTERDQLSDILKDRSLNDENNYIRIKAKAALQEVYR